jgi:N-acetylglucosamine kinase-like BadF-type ATPase
LWETYNLHVENFYSYIKINKELRDFDLKRNYKTKIALCDAEGQFIGHSELSGCSYREIGARAVSTILNQGIGEVCGGIDRSDIRGVCFGMSCYGEHEEEDREAIELIEKELALPIRFENDVACAWSGALALRSGIVLLAGTGSMAWGRDDSGKMYRSGGWSNFYSDEGSGYWLGRRALELFTKQSDGRVERGPLYDIVRGFFSINNDFDLIEIIDEQYLSTRKSIASLQLLLHKASEEGDASAIELFREAAKELALMVKGLRKHMDLISGSPVSYAGGLFKAGEVLLGPFKRELEDTDLKFAEPLLSPVHGALLFAIDRFDPGSLDRIREVFLHR